MISLAFSRVEGQDILWIMGSSGIQGYLVSGTNLLAIYPQNFYGNLGFTEGDKLKIDSQNNVWIITQHSGVRIIKSNTEQWPDENGFTSSNSGLLSNTVYDVAFDNSSGRVYFATKSGINILKAPFALDDSNNSKDEISISPNPIFLPSSDGHLFFPSHQALM